jgi:hypothetical protein
MGDHVAYMKGRMPVCVIALALLAGAPSAAMAQEAAVRIAVFEPSDRAGLLEDEVDTLMSVVSLSLEELPRESYAVEAAQRPVTQGKKACDDQCLLDGASGAGAAYAVVGDLKRIKKAGSVLTIRLLAVADGQVLHSSVSEVCPDLNGLLEAARAASSAMKDRLESLIVVPEPEPPPPVEPPAPAPVPEAPPVGTLRINSSPPGAQILLGSSKREAGRPVGAAPLEMILKPWTYWVTANAAGYLDHRERTTIGAGKIVTMDIVLEVDEWPPLRAAAHGTLWPGLASGLLGGAAGYLSWRRGKDYGDELDGGLADLSRQWAVTMYVAGGLSAALVTTSIICFALWKKEGKSRARIDGATVLAAPTTDGPGGALALGGRF